MGTFAGKHAFDESWLRAAEDGSLPRVASQDPRFSAILALPDFERFVYVLSVLEGCTDQECATFWVRQGNRSNRRDFGRYSTFGNMTEGEILAAGSQRPGF